MYRRLIQESPHAFPVEQTLQHFEAGMQVFAAGSARAFVTGSVWPSAHAIRSSDTLSDGSTAGAARDSTTNAPRRRLEVFTAGKDTLPPGKFR